MNSIKLIQMKNEHEHKHPLTTVYWLLSTLILYNLIGIGNCDAERYNGVDIYATNMLDMLNFSKRIRDYARKERRVSMIIRGTS